MSGSVLDMASVLTAQQSWCRGRLVARPALLLTRFAKFLNVTGLPSPAKMHKG